MAWSSSSASAQECATRANSDAAVDAILNDAANLLRDGDAEAAAALIHGLSPHLIDSTERCDLAGLILIGAGAAADALAWFDRARLLQPVNWKAAAHMGIALLELRQFKDALAAFNVAVGQGYVDPATYYHRGVALRALGRRDEAIAALDQALRAQPDYPEALRMGGLILSEAGRTDQALAFLEGALRSQPRYFEALLDRANLLRQMERYDEALAAFSHALTLFPGNAEFLNNRGVVFIDLGELDRARADFDAALAAKPDVAEARFNRGTVLIQADPQAALVDFNQAIALRPVYPDAYVGRGVALKELSRIDDALASFDTALAQNPDSAHARNNKGAVQLLLGDFEQGLVGYEYRWIIGQTHKFKLEFPIPEWRGEVRPGEKLIVFDEQGIGDTIQFCRYLPQLAEAGLDVTFFCRSKALRLLASLPHHKVHCVDTFGPEEHFDSQIALSSLPYALGTRLSSIPASVPYLTAEPDLVAAWASRLAQGGSKRALKIGLCWAGNPDVRADPRRSIPLECFLPLMALEGVRVISLQKHHGLDEIASLPEAAALETLGNDFDNEPDAFIDSAAVMQNLDLIVSCDTSVAHLAGALARPTFVLLRKIPDWRWMLEREDSPWYPTMRLFRQPRPGDWNAVVSDVIAAVEAMRDQLARVA